jgi:hypothetical protein
MLSNMKADQATFRYELKKTRSEVQTNVVNLRILGSTIKIINGKTFKTLIGSNLIHPTGLLLARRIALHKNTFQANKKYPCIIFILDITLRPLWS